MPNASNSASGTPCTPPSRPAPTNEDGALLSDCQESTVYSRTSYVNNESSRWHLFHWKRPDRRAAAAVAKKEKKALAKEEKLPLREMELNVVGPRGASSAVGGNVQSQRSPADLMDTPHHSDASNALLLSTPKNSTESIGSRLQSVNDSEVFDADTIEEHEATELVFPPQEHPKQQSARSMSHSRSHSSGVAMGTSSRQRRNSCYTPGRPRSYDYTANSGRVFLVDNPDNPTKIRLKRSSHHRRASSGLSRFTKNPEYVSLIPHSERLTLNAHDDENVDIICCMDSELRRIGTGEATDANEIFRLYSIFDAAYHRLTPMIRVHISKNSYSYKNRDRLLRFARRVKPEAHRFHPLPRVIYTNGYMQGDWREFARYYAGCLFCCWTPWWSVCVRR